MKPKPEFARLPRDFWAHVRFISETTGYSDRTTPGLRRYTLDDMSQALWGSGLSVGYVRDRNGRPTSEGRLLVRYLNFRADTLEKVVEPNLMNKSCAKTEFQSLRRCLRPTCYLPMNKQKGSKRHHNYLACIVNMLTAHTLAGRAFDDRPSGLTLTTKDGQPLRTFARWMDGAYPSRVDPYAVWEVKEYYGTKTFGSRVADGVYETLLDGEELAELQATERVKVHHYLFVDDHFAWWDCGRSYLCRIMDLLHMGLVDEVIFGREVLTRWPKIVANWPANP